MIAYVVGGIAAAGVAIVIIARVVRPARAIWRGDASKVPRTHQSMLAVGPRTYPTYLLAAVTFSAGWLACGVGVALGGLHRATTPGWPTYVVGIGVLLWVSTVVLVPLNWLVDATNRPKFLVPPPFRDEPGAIRAARERRRRPEARFSEIDDFGETAGPVGLVPEEGQLRPADEA